MIYKKILLSADLIPEDDDPVALKAFGIAETTKAELTILHVLEYPFAYGLASMQHSLASWMTELEQAAKNKLQAMGKRFNIPDERLVLELGQPKEKILETAERLEIDLIIVGSHGRHGINLFLLGSTASGVLHHARCDVLAVRVQQ